jgi:hypothetical protein
LHILSAASRADVSGAITADGRRPAS